MSARSLRAASLGLPSALALVSALALAGPASAARREPAGEALLGVAIGIDTSAPAQAGYGAEGESSGPGAAIETSAPEASEPKEPGGSQGPVAPDELYDPSAAGDAELASIDDDFLDEELGPDPAERDHTPRWNRRVFAFNEGFVRWIMRPIARAYQAVTPEFLREMIARGFDNLESPVILANDLMQLDACRAGRTLGRFALNTTAGVGGLFDVASEMGIARHDTDFGETLGRWGVRSGPFLMLPVLGPSTARDTLSELVDTVLRPEVWLLGGFPQLALTGGDGLATYDIQGERLDALRDTSIDFYAALRSAYLMDRDAKIEELRSAGRCGIGRRDAEE